MHASVWCKAALSVSPVCCAGDGYIALEFPAGRNSASPHLMASAAEDNNDYVIRMPPLTFLRHFREVSFFMTNQPTSLLQLKVDDVFGLQLLLAHVGSNV